MSSKLTILQMRLDFLFLYYGFSIANICYVSQVLDITMIIHINLGVVCIQFLLSFLKNIK